MRSLISLNEVNLPDADHFDMGTYKKKLLDELDKVVQEATEKEWFNQYKAITASKDSLIDKPIAVAEDCLQDKPNRRKPVPYWEKFNLTIEEASIYFEIGDKKMRKLIEQFEGKGLFIRNGRKTLIKRSKFEQFLNGLDAI